MHNNNKKPRPPEVPLSEATIPTRLAEIRARCSDLLDANGDLALGLDGDEPAREPGGAYNPYNRSG